MAFITSEEHRRALDYAAASVDFTVDRMRYGGLASGTRRRLLHIYVGKAVELAVLRIMRRDFQLQLDPAPVETSHDEPDRADWLLTTNQGAEFQLDMKSFHIFRTFGKQHRTCESVHLRSTALVPVDQLRDYPKDFYVFATILGNTSEPDQATGIPVLEEGTELCDLRWESRDGVEQWERIARGTAIYPYAATRTTNKGRRMTTLREIQAMADLVR